MIFNSLEFALFLPIVFVLYWLAQPKRRVQNALLLIASYVFYGWWDWRFLFLIFASSAVDYIIALSLQRQVGVVNRRFLLGVSLWINLGLLGLFKYYNFFVDSFVGTFSFFGVAVEGASLSWILPVGISFYTFQTLSYTIDVYRRKIDAVRDPVAFFSYVSFFPQLVAGPIERASNLIPQFLNERKFKYSEAADGLRQILWGLFKKVVIADNCAVLVNQIFSDTQSYPGGVLALGAVLFAFQIYGDFSGYSDIAIGTSRLFGFKLMRNFAFPYFSRDIGEFWRRWHISLSSWFKDYIYIPLGGSRCSTAKNYRNVMVIFLVSGFWHGANWTFVIWGALHAIYFVPLMVMGQNRQHTDEICPGRILPSLNQFIRILATFSMVCVAWVFFRADNVTEAFAYLSRMAETLFTDLPGFVQFVDDAVEALVAIVLLLLVEWFQRHREHGLELSHLKYGWLRWLIYYGVIAALYYHGGAAQDFIYFQF